MNSNELNRLMIMDHTVSIPGSAILFLANAMRERQIGLMQELADAHEDGEDAFTLADIQLDIDATEVMGAFILSMIRDTFGGPFLDNFLAGKVDIPLITPMEAGTC